MPSIHSSVSTRRALRVQSTFGTRKPSSFLVFSAISEMAAASMRKSISMATDFASVSTTAIGRSRRERRMEALDHAGGEEVAVEIAVEALLDAGAQHLDGDRLQRAVRHPHLGLVHLGDRGGGDRRSELGEQRIDGRAERLLDRLPRFALREGRQAVLQRGEIGGELAADDVVAGGEELAELDVGRPERGERGRQLAPRCRPSPCAVLAERRGHAAEQSERRRQVRIVGQARARPTRR